MMILHFLGRLPIGSTGGRLDVFWYFQYSFCSVALSSELVILYYQSRVPEVKTRLAVWDGGKGTFKAFRDTQC